MTREVWADGQAYEAYVGRWSRLVAAEFVRWLAPPSGRRWLDVGCGTGALTAALLDRAEPARVTGVDASHGFVAHARDRVADARAAFHVGDARALPLPDRSVDVVASGLTLNFVPDPAAAVAEFARVVRPGGTVAAYVWDYADGMALMRHFWDAAAELDPLAAELDEAARFAICAPTPLGTLWADAGLRSVTVRPIEVPTDFADFDDYWRPFLGGQGAAPAYLMALPAPHRDALRDLLASRVPAGPDGAIRLTARAWAVRGTVPA